MSDNPAAAAVAPRTNCGTTGPLVALTFVFTAWLVGRGTDVRGASAAAIGLAATVPALTSVRLSGLDVRVARSKSTIPGVL
ncbi:MAG TPA: hypothetical protein VNO31_17835 [Umezawaea sp.]|nr:hypothetical protein [Umezawaea sp.]